MISEKQTKSKLRKILSAYFDEIINSDQIFLHIELELETEEDVSLEASALTGVVSRRPTGNKILRIRWKPKPRKAKYNV